MVKITQMEKPIKLSRSEQETIITFTSADKTASIYTCDPVILKYMEKVSDMAPDAYTLEEEVYTGGELLSRTYSCPKKYVRPRKVQPMTEERRQQLLMQLGHASAEKPEGEEEPDDIG